jgi:hypothetical protein
MGNVIIDQSVQGHDSPDRADRDVRLRQQAPDPKLPSIRMDLLQVIHLHHKRQPDLAGWRVGRAALVHEPGEVLGLKPLDPRIDRGPRHVQEAADADLLLTLIVEFHHLQAGLVAVGVGVIVPQAQVFLTGDRTLLPQGLDRPMVDRHAAGDK